MNNTNKKGCFKMTMGERIHQLRNQQHMTQAELAQRLGVGRSAVLKYEKGEVKNIPYDTIKKMATIFGVTPAYLQCFDQWDEEQLADEVKLIERIQAVWGKEMVCIMQHYCELNEAGQKTMLTIAESLNELNKYKK